MDIKLAILLVACLQLCASNPLDAPCTCQRYFEPVCGSDGITYHNKCLLECKSSTNNYITLAKLGRCDAGESGICGCSLEYIPVCGNDGQTYPNTCHLSCQYRDKPSLDVAYEGECKLNIPIPNMCVCGNNYNPVCGSDGITYDNDCLLNCATAKNPRLSIAYYSRCRGNPLARDAVKVVEPKFEY